MTEWLRDLRGLSLVEVSWFLSVDGDGVLTIPELKDEVFLCVFYYFEKSFLWVLKRGLLGVAPHKNKDPWHVGLV